MIEWLELTDFQCHQQLQVELGQSVVVLVGPSDAGKSAVLRALRWLVTDRPLGDACVREGAGGCEVVLQVDGQQVFRRRFARRNEYAIDAQIFKAWGSAPPAPVQQLLNLGPENFQGQHDAPFWLTLTAGEVAKQLNAIVDLAVVDELVGTLSGRVRQARAVQEVTAQRLEAAKQEVARLVDVPRLQQALRRLQGLQQVAFTQAGRAAALRRGVETGRLYAISATQLRRVVRAGQRVLTAGVRARAALASAGALRQAVVEVHRQREIAGRKQPDLGPLTAARAQWESSETSVRDLRGIVESIRGACEQQKRTQQGLQAAAAELERQLQGKCPVCHRPLTLKASSSRLP